MVKGKGRRERELGRTVELYLSDNGTGAAAVCGAAMTLESSLGAGGLGFVWVWNSGDEED